MEPTEKSQEIEDFVSSIAGKSRKKSIENDKCAWCGSDVAPWTFNDKRSLDEYRISGMCQKCQNEIFEV